MYPLEEHLKEGLRYGKSESVVRLHFTLSPQFFDVVQDEIIRIKESFDAESEFEVTYSAQSDSTNVVAVDEANWPVELKDGSLLFRPGGHGALLNNLNEQDAQLIFVKNIERQLLKGVVLAVAKSFVKIGKH